PPGEALGCGSQNGLHPRILPIHRTRRRSAFRLRILTCSISDSLCCFHCPHRIVSGHCPTLVITVWEAPASVPPPRLSAPYEARSRSHSLLTQTLRPRAVFA